MSERRGSCKHATTRSRREGGGGLILACDVAPLSLLDPRFTLSSLSLSLSLSLSPILHNQDQISDIQFPNCHGTKKLSSALE